MKAGMKPPVETSGYEQLTIVPAARRAYQQLRVGFHGTRKSSRVNPH